jgi:hypothetical protein
MKITRRGLVLGGAGVSAAPLLAQAPQAPPAVGSTPEEELAAARKQNASNAAALDKFRVPMATEPAFQFKA